MDQITHSKKIFLVLALIALGLLLNRKLSSQNIQAENSKFSQEAQLKAEKQNKNEPKISSSDALKPIPENTLNEKKEVPDSKNLFERIPNLKRIEWLMAKAIQKPNEKSELNKLLKDTQLMNHVFDYFQADDLLLNNGDLKERFALLYILLKSASLQNDPEHSKYIYGKMNEFIIAEPSEKIFSQTDKLSFFYGDRIEILTYLSKTNPSLYWKLKNINNSDFKAKNLFLTAETAAPMYEIGI